MIDRKLHNIFHVEMIKANIMCERETLKRFSQGEKTV